MYTDNSALFTIMKKHFSNIFDLDLSAQIITEYAVPSMEMIESITFMEWIHEIVGKMQFVQIKPFTEKMKISHIVEQLETQSAYLVEYQTKNEDSLECYQLVLCYGDENKEHIIITRQDVSVHALENEEHFIELEKDSARFRFIISHLCENFGEIHVKTGKTWMTTCNDWEVSQGNLREQIEWFAENLIVKEQKEAYCKEFELENLVNNLRKNNGFYAPIYEANYPDGKRYLLIINALMNGMENPEEEYIFSFVQDITQLKTQEAKNKHLLDISQELLTLSQIEPMTKLYNRIAGEKMIREYLQTKSKYAMAALLVIDIDYFKKFNDQYGHPTGDSVLKYLATSMQGVFRGSDIICRWGGDEFVIFMPDVAGLAIVEERIEELQTKMSSHQRNHSPLPITLSIGGVMFKKIVAFDKLFEEADQYLYQVKSAGRDNYEVVVKE